MPRKILSFFCYFSFDRWISLRLDFIGNCVILFAALFAVISRDKIESSLAGLSIVYALQVRKLGADSCRKHRSKNKNDMTVVLSI